MLEKWLTKYETLYPKGPILGYCAGQPVYRRACVQTLHTSDRWLRECRKVKVGESAAKVKALTFFFHFKSYPFVFSFKLLRLDMLAVSNYGVSIFFNIQSENVTVSTWM